MPEIREKHPSWFKLKLERRELLRQLSPETAFAVLFACLEYLETGERPAAMSPIENIVFAAFVPDLEDAWSSYLQRVSARKTGKITSDDIERNRSISSDTEEDGEEEDRSKKVEGDSMKEILCAATPHIRAGAREHTRKSTRFVPPTLEEVTAYIRERSSRVNPQGFIDFYASKGWKVGKTPMKDWKAACRNAEHWERWNKAGQSAPHQSGSGNIFADMARQEGIF